MRWPHLGDSRAQVELGSRGGTKESALADLEALGDCSVQCIGKGVKMFLSKRAGTTGINPFRAELLHQVA